MLVYCYFYICSGEQPSQWSVGVSASWGESQTSSDTDKTGKIWVKESLAVIFLRYSSGCTALWGFAESLSCRKKEDQQEEEMTVSHLWEENKLRRSETWSHMALDSLTLSALSLLHSLFLPHPLMHDFSICMHVCVCVAAFWNFSHFLFPLSVRNCCTVQKF